MQEAALSRPTRRPPRPPSPAAATILALAVALAACTDHRRLGPPVTRFGTATMETAAVIRPYLVDLNRVERGSAFAEALADPRQPIADDPDGGRRFLAPTFDPEGIAVRLEALRLVELYALGLARAVDSDRTDRLAAETIALGHSVGALGDRVRRLAGHDPAIAAYATPIAGLTAAVGRLWTEHAEAKVLRIAVSDAAPVVDTFVRLLADDVDAAHQRRLGAVLERYDDLAADYNARRLAMPASERAALLTQLEALADRYEALAAQPPTALLQDLRTANALLASAIADSGNPQSLAAFSAAVRSFSANAAAALLLVAELRRAS